MSITLSVKGVLIALLLIALIILTIYLIVLISNLIQTIKKTNDIIDEGMLTVSNAKQKIGNVTNGLKAGAGKIGGADSPAYKIVTKFLGKNL